MFVTTVALGKQRREVDALEAQWLIGVGEYDRSGDWAIDGFLSAASALASTCRMDAGVARYYVLLARSLARLPVAAEAYAAGDISLRHVQVFADAYTKKRAEALAAAEPILVAEATEQTPKEFAVTVQRLIEAIDGGGGAESDADEFEARQLFLAKTLAGRGDIRGNCDPLSFDIIESAIRAEMDRDFQAGDERTTRARRRWRRITDWAVWKA